MEKSIIILCFTAIDLLAKSSDTFILTEPSGYKVEDLFRNLTEVQKQLSTLQNQFGLMNSRIDKLLSKGPGPDDVYFSAQIQKNLVGLAVGDTVIYDHDFINHGGGYDARTGIFTAPTAGLYIFHIACDSAKAGELNLVIRQNGDLKANCFVEPAFDGEDEMSANVYISNQSVGDKVWVEIYSFDKDSVDLVENLNHFTGALVRRYD